MFLAETMTIFLTFLRKRVFATYVRIIVNFPVLSNYIYIPNSCNFIIISQHATWYYFMFSLYFIRIVCTYGYSYYLTTIIKR